MPHAQKVAELAAKYGLPSKIPEDELWATRIEFLDAQGNTLAIIEGTPMNCASRLLIQSLSEEFDGLISLTHTVRRRVEDYFAERWDHDWSPNHRPMLYWLDDRGTATIVAHGD